MQLQGHAHLHVNGSILLYGMYRFYINLDRIYKPSCNTLVYRYMRARDTGLSNFTKCLPPSPTHNFAVF